MRTALFVPGDRPDRVAKALRCRADAIVIDLEDAVSAAGKAGARVSARGALEAMGPGSQGGPLVGLRVNAIISGLTAEDVAAFGPVLATLDFLVLPKADSPADVHALTRLVAGCVDRVPPVVPIVESAAGVHAARDTARADGVRTLMFGAADLSSQLGIRTTPEGTELLLARSELVLAAAAAGRQAPIDGPYLRLDDAEGLRTSARSARTLGFGGKAVIHPRDLPVVEEVFGPDESEIEWARGVVTAFAEAEKAGRGVCRLPDGTFVDAPVVARAWRVLGTGPGERVAP